MSNVFRLCPLSDIFYCVIDGAAPGHDLPTLLQSGWRPERDQLAAPSGTQLWMFTITNESPQDYFPIPTVNDTQRDQVLTMLNTALTIDMHYRHLDLQIPPLSISFFIVNDDDLYSYMNFSHFPCNFADELGAGDYSMDGLLADLILQANALVYQPSPPVPNSFPKPSDPVFAITEPHDDNEMSVDNGATPTTSPLRCRVTPKRHLRLPQKNSKCFVVESHPWSDIGLTLPDVISVKVPKFLAHRIPRRIKYEPILSVAPCDTADEVTTEDAILSNKIADSDQGYESDKSATDGESTETSRATAAPVIRRSTICAQLLVLIQQHVQDAFFCDFVAEVWRKLGNSSISFPVMMPDVTPSSSKVRDLLLAASVLPAWRTVTNAVPLHQPKSHQNVTPRHYSINNASIDLLNVDDCELLLGFDGDIRTLSSSSMYFWEEACLEPFKSKADISCLVIPSLGTTPFERNSVIGSFTESLSVMYETCMLGRHSPIKCLDEILLLPEEFRASETLSDADCNDPLIVQHYYDFVIERLCSSAMRSKISSTDTSIVVIYLIADYSTFTIDLISFSMIMNRLRLALGAPTWNSTSRRKNVVGQIVPRSIVNEIFHRNESLPVVLKRLAFSVFSRSHFVPVIPVDDVALARTHELHNGLGLTAWEPPFVLHCRTGIPCPPHVAVHNNTCSLLAVHVSYMTVDAGLDEQWVVGCATDMRGERLYTACVRSSAGRSLFTVLSNFWVECIRPALDFLHSRTDQGAMSLIINKTGVMPREESMVWTRILAERLGGVWLPLSEEDLRCGDNSNPPESIIATDVAAEIPLAFQPDIRFLVSSAFLVSCTSPAKLQPIDSGSKNAIIMHRHRDIDHLMLPSIVHANVYFLGNISVKLSLESYVLHAPANRETIEAVTPGLVFDAFHSVAEQSIVLNAFNDTPGSGLPLHFATTQRLGLLFTTVLKQLNLIT
uniref:Mediator of RNA polymerase II transcription subunit 13 n=1 Tax=Spongospora subterranea TaxID=70186 RepID=A0A0H5QGC6_9EUKA|eukprot:CRZ01108.1 hypothetical protein [Spongospora subterranea]